MPKNIQCESCRGIIITKNDLVVTSIYFKPTTYHKKCYDDDMKGMNSVFLSQPYNTLSGTIISIIVAISCVLFFIFNSSILRYIVLFFAFIPVFYRLYSWLVFEKHLP